MRQRLIGEETGKCLQSIRLTNCIIQKIAQVNGLQIIMTPGSTEDCSLLLETGTNYSSLLLGTVKTARFTPLECTAAFGLAPVRRIIITTLSTWFSLEVKPVCPLTVAASELRFVRFLFRIFQKIP